MDDEDDGFMEVLYEDGHWAWDESVESLVFVCDRPPESAELVTVSNRPPPTGTIEFKDDADLFDQIRFRRKYQRKVKLGQADVVTLQDLKDIALFTAPLQLLSLQLIHILHLPTVERFLRALLLYCHYYLQIAETMTYRMTESKAKIRTKQSQVVENVFRENLSDLRTLVAKEYCTLLIGGADLRRYHHMGPNKKMISLSNKDAHLMETLIRMFVQIVWIGLGRKSFNKIELEVNRLFKSDIFNSAEHILKTDYIEKMCEEEEDVLLGRCVRHDKKLTARSPLMNEVMCDRDIDFRQLSLGVIKYKEPLNDRLRYFEAAITYPEESFKECNITNGLLGISRALFDSFLRPIVQVSTSRSTQSLANTVTTRISDTSKTKPKTMFPDLDLPSKTEDTSLYAHMDSFPEYPAAIRSCNYSQRQRWENRYHRLLRCRTSISTSISMFK